MLPRLPTWLWIGGGLVVAYKAWRWWGPRPLADDATDAGDVVQQASNTIGKLCDFVGLNAAAGDQSTLPDPTTIADFTDDDYGSDDGSIDDTSDDSGDDGFLGGL